MTFEIATAVNKQFWKAASLATEDESQLWMDITYEVVSVQYDTSARIVFRTTEGQNFMFDSSSNMKWRFKTNGVETGQVKLERVS
jgi:hypothetical protein